jgi:sec-independent protein translocase protein TatA
MGLDNPLHIAFLVVILLLVFGARRLPEIGRSLGSGMREFKDSISGEGKQPTITQATPQPPQATAPQATAQPASPPQAAAQPPSPQQAADAFGNPPEEQRAAAPVEPTRQA